VYYSHSTDRSSNFICIGVLAASLVFTIILRICLMLENRRRDRLSREKYDCEAAIKEPYDLVSSYLINFIFFLITILW
jgi:NADH:ubiquinone oxidoreductase subunit 3 (subunit A)